MEQKSFFLLLVIFSFLVTFIILSPLIVIHTSPFLIKKFFKRNLSFKKVNYSIIKSSINIHVIVEYNNDKIRQAPKANKDGVPSIGWFYNAANLVAHERVFVQEGLHTFGILGHSHKSQLLYAPKLKGIPADEIKKTITESNKCTKNYV